MGEQDTWAIFGCLTIIAAAIWATVWLKREGDRLWRIETQRTVTIHLALDTTAFVASMAAASAAISQMGRSMQDFQTSMQKVAATINTTTTTEADE